MTLSFEKFEWLSRKTWRNEEDSSWTTLMELELPAPTRDLKRTFLFESWFCLKLRRYTKGLQASLSYKLSRACCRQTLSWFYWICKWCKNSFVCGISQTHLCLEGLLPWKFRSIYLGKQVLSLHFKENLCKQPRRISTCQSGQFTLFCSLASSYAKPPS